MLCNSRLKLVVVKEDVDTCKLVFYGLIFISIHFLKLKLDHVIVCVHTELFYLTVVEIFQYVVIGYFLRALRLAEEIRTQEYHHSRQKHVK